MALIFKKGPIEIWAVNEPWGVDYWVVGFTKDPRVCPSIGMAYEVTAA